MGGRRGAAEEELMTRPQHVCPNKGCGGYALGSDDGDIDAARRLRSVGTATRKGQVNDQNAGTLETGTLRRRRERSPRGQR